MSKLWEFLRSLGRKNIISIQWVCDPCGLEANRRTCLKKYGRKPLKPKYEVSTYHLGKCDVCGKYAPVTQPRDFFYPDFNLLKGRK